MSTPTGFPSRATTTALPPPVSVANTSSSVGEAPVPATAQPFDDRDVLDVPSFLRDE